MRDTIFLPVDFVYSVKSHSAVNIDIAAYISAIYGIDSALIGSISLQNENQTPFRLTGNALTGIVNSGNMDIPLVFSYVSADETQFASGSFSLTMNVSSLFGEVNANDERHAFASLLSIDLDYAVKPVFGDFDRDGKTDFALGGGALTSRILARYYERDNADSAWELVPDDSGDNPFGQGHSYNAAGVNSALTLLSNGGIAVSNKNGNGDALDGIVYSYKPYSSHSGYRFQGFIWDSEMEQRIKKFGADVYPIAVDLVPETVELLVLSGEKDSLSNIDNDLHYYHLDDEGNWSLQNNPFANLVTHGNFKDFVSMAFLDVDGDGDQDVIGGAVNGTLHYFAKTESGWDYRAGQDSPFSQVDVGDSAYISITDLDEDGDEDIVIGNAAGQLAILEGLSATGYPTFAAIEREALAIKQGVAATIEIGEYFSQNELVFRVSSSSKYADNFALVGGDKLVGSVDWVSENIDFTVTAIDPEARAETNTINVSVIDNPDINFAPQLRSANLVINYIVNDGSRNDFNIGGWFVDRDIGEVGAGKTLSYEFAAPAEHIRIMPKKESEAGIFEFMNLISSPLERVYSFSVTVTDEDGLTAEAPIEITVRPHNVAPEAKVPSAPISITEHSSEPEFLILSQIFSDANEQELTYSYELDRDDERSELTDRLPDIALKHDDRFGHYLELKATTHEDFVVAVEATDPYGASARASLHFDVRNVNDKPEVSRRINEIIFYEGQENSFDLTPLFTDEEGDPLTYEISEVDESQTGRLNELGVYVEGDRLKSDYLSAAAILSDLQVEILARDMPQDGTTSGHNKMIVNFSVEFLNDAPVVRAGKDIAQDYETIALAYDSPPLTINLSEYFYDRDASLTHADTGLPYDSLRYSLSAAHDGKEFYTATDTQGVFILDPSVFRQDDYFITATATDDFGESIAASFHIPVRRGEKLMLPEAHDLADISYDWNVAENNFSVYLGDNKEQTLWSTDKAFTGAVPDYLEFRESANAGAARHSLYLAFGSYGRSIEAPEFYDDIRDENSVTLYVLSDYDHETESFVAVAADVSVGEGAGTSHIYGTSGDNVLTGHSGEDVFYSSAGFDTIDGGGGEDTLILAGYEAATVYVLTDDSAAVPENVNLLSGYVKMMLPDTIFYSTQVSDVENYKRLSGSETFEEARRSAIESGQSGHVHTVYGSNADNIFEVGYGDDMVIGRGGRDTVIYRSAMDDVVLNLDAAARDILIAEPWGADGYGSRDLLSAIEVLVFEGSPSSVTHTVTGYGGSLDYTGDDAVDIVSFQYPGGVSGYSVLRGHGGNDILAGHGAADDELYGGAGDDTLIYSGGNDIIDGGEGINTLKIEIGKTMQEVRLGEDGNVQITYKDDTSEYGKPAASHIRNIIISAFTDEALKLFGNSLDNVIESDYNHDTLYGGKGHDRLYGHRGHDTLSGDAGNDKLYGGSGRDILLGDLVSADDMDGGEDYDKAVYNGVTTGLSINKSGADFASNNDRYTVTFYNAQADENMQDKLIRIEAIEINNAEGYESVNHFFRGGNYSIHLRTSSGADTIYASEGEDIVHAGDGNDEIHGDWGSDSLYGEGGNDTIYGGLGHDKLYGGDGNDTIKGNKGEDEIYGNAGADILYGDENNDKLYGGVGADTLYGGAGDDILRGDENDDIFYADAGSDSINGGLGSDTLIFSGYLSSVSVSLKDGRVFADGYGGADNLESVENITLDSGDFVGANRLAGDANANVIIGDAGSDTVIGGGGADMLSGGGHDDTFIISDMDFVSIDGGSGSDILSFSDSFSGIVDFRSIEEKIFNIELIDLTSPSEAMKVILGADSMFSFGAANSLRIKADADDKIYFEDFSDWVRSSAPSGQEGFFMTENNGQEDARSIYFENSASSVLMLDDSINYNVYSFMVDGSVSRDCLRSHDASEGWSLISDGDVFIEGFRPGVDRLSLLSSTDVPLLRVDRLAGSFSARVVGDDLELFFGGSDSYVRIAAASGESFEGYDMFDGVPGFRNLRELTEALGGGEYLTFG